jgi:monovalent cation/hydrogen antiporter
MLGLRVNATEEIQVRNEARLAALAAASAAVDDMEADAGLPEPIAAGLRDAIRQRTDRLRARISLLEDADGEIGLSPELDAAAAAQHAVIAAQREELIRWRDCGRLPDESLRQLQHELDLQERTLPGNP